MASLSLDDQEDAIEEAQRLPRALMEENKFSLVGCFLTAGIIHFPAMRSTLANLWHPVKGIEILDLGEKRFLFQFFHWMDFERVIKGASWTFNNHLLIFHRLLEGKDPMKVPLITVSFWVQIHYVPPGFFIEILVRQLGNFIGHFLEYDCEGLAKGQRSFMCVRVAMVVWIPLKRKKASILAREYWLCFFQI